MIPDRSDSDRWLGDTTLTRRRLLLVVASAGTLGTVVLTDGFDRLLGALGIASRGYGTGGYGAGGYGR